MKIAFLCQGRELELCLEGDRNAAPIWENFFPQALPAGKLTRFTRLAGMFMGRVSAATIGDMRILISLELR